jgi:hypothetical protein
MPVKGSKDSAMNSYAFGADVVKPDHPGLGKCNVVCPMCQHKHIQFRLNPRMYWNMEKAIDGQPIKFHTLQSIAGCHPPLFELWHCPNCHYTSNHRTFMEPLKDVFVEKGFVQRKYAELMRTAGPSKTICDLLGADISIETTSFPQSIRLASLALFVDRFFSQILQHRYFALAWSYMRLGWFYRDWAELVPDAADERQTLNALLDQVAENWPELPRTETTALQEASKTFTQVLQESSVASDESKTVEVQIILTRTKIQLGEKEQAHDWLKSCYSEAREYLNTITTSLQRDEKKRQLSTEERSNMSSDRRKMETIIRQCQDLHELLDKKG